MRFKKGSFSANFLLLFSGNTIAQIIPFLLFPLITRVFSAEEIAVRGHFIALASTIAIAAAGRYEVAIVLPSDKSKAMNLMSLSLRLITIFSLLSTLCYFFRDQIDAFYDHSGIGDYMIFVVIAVPLYALTNVWSQWLIREKKYRAVTSSGIARALFKDVFAVFFGYMTMGVWGLIAGLLIGYLIAFVIMYIASISSLDFSLTSKSGRLEVAKQFKDFPVINGPHAFVDLLFSQVILFWIIDHYFGLDNLGFYIAMSTLLLASMRAVGGAVGQLYYKEASDLKAAGGNVSKVMFRSVGLVSLFAIPACIGVLFFGPDLFAWYNGDSYRLSGEYAQIMIVPFLLNFLTSPISVTPIIYRKQTQAFIFSLAGYSISIAALVVANTLHYSFKEALFLFAITQSIYYLSLFFWYFYLTKNRS